MRRVLLLVGIVGVHAWLSKMSLLSQAQQAAKCSLVTCACAASLFSAPSATLAAPPTMNDAIVEFSEALHPILAIQNTAFPPFTEQVAALVFNSVQPTKLAKSIEISLDALTSVPSETIATFNGVVKDSFAGLQIDSCPVVPLPPADLLGKIEGTEAGALVDTAKLRAWDAAWGSTLKLLPKSDDYPGPDGKKYSVICLPPPEALDKLALAQADVGRAIGAAELKAFKDVVPTTLQAINPTDAIPLAKTAEKLAKIPPAQQVRLNAARKAVEKAAENDAYKARLAEINARSAAAKAALDAKNAAKGK